MEAEALVLCDRQRKSTFLKAGGKISSEGLVGMHSPGTFQENFLGLGNIWVGNTAVYRTNRRALFLVEEADTLGAFLGSYIVDVFLDRGIGRPIKFPRRSSLVDGGVWALWFARAAVDALFSNQRRHIPNCSPTSRGLRSARPGSVCCLDLNGKNIGGLRREQVSVPAPTRASW
jgi:hypothetical protein